MSFNGCCIRDIILQLDKDLVNDEYAKIIEDEEEYEIDEIVVKVFLSGGRVLQPLLWKSESKRFVVFNVVPHDNKAYSILKVPKEDIICIGLYNTMGLIDKIMDNNNDNNSQPPKGLYM